MPTAPVRSALATSGGAVATAASACAELLRDGWWASSAPIGFFADLAERPARPLRAATAASLALLLATLALAVAFVRGTGSDALGLVWLLLALVALPYVVLAVGLGGLVMVRPTALDLRAWELAAWSWAPAGALGLSLLPAAFAAPAVTAALGLVTFPLWHLLVLARGLRALRAERPVAALILYVLAASAAPALLVLVGWATLAALG